MNLTKNQITNLMDERARIIELNKEQILRLRERISNLEMQISFYEQDNQEIIKEMSFGEKHETLF